jgi:hypothetical protein
MSKASLSSRGVLTFTTSRGMLCERSVQEIQNISQHFVEQVGCGQGGRGIGVRFPAEARHDV